MTAQNPIDDILNNTFGLQSFRPGQRDIATSVIDEKCSVLVVMPTGAGKSLCYQLPACILTGVTLVVSPLIALMKDQVDALYKRGISATCINSSQSWRDQQMNLRGLKEGLYKIVYVAPERFRNDLFMDALADVDIGLFAIDEAHCISQWGHDFRPDYRDLGLVRQKLNNPVTIALTATATPEVRDDILEQLSLRDARVVVSGFERPNLFFAIEHTQHEHDKYTHLRALLERYCDLSTVVYCATRRQVDEIRSRVEHDGHVVGAYHAGLSEQQRNAVQDAFMAGDIPVLIATNAFGMGIDKADVRSIIHFNMPGSLEAYYQEAGRAGRDGEPAQCTLLYSTSDQKVHTYFLESSFPTADIITRVWSELRRHGMGTHAIGPATISDHINRSKDTLQVNEATVASAFRCLHAAAHIEFGWRDGFPWVAVRDQTRAKHLRVDWDQLALRRHIAQRHLTQMVRYADQNVCRANQLLRHFDSQAPTQYQCGHCDVCVDYIPDSLTQFCRPKRIQTPDHPNVLIQKVLSGIARTKGRHDSRAITAMLRGSTSKQLTALRLNALSTFGILGFLTPSHAMEIVLLCERHRLTTQTMKGHILLTDEGVEVMQGKRELPQRLEERLAKRICIIEERQP